MLNQRVFLFSLLLGLLGAVASFAASETSFDNSVFAFSCTSPEDASDPLECSIGQYGSAGEATAAGLSKSYDKWADFVVALDNDMRETYSANGLNITLKTDFDLGGSRVDKGTTSCVNNFVPIDFELYTEKLKKFNGGNHTIRNFCHIVSSGDAGFFRHIPTNATVDRLTFEGAYVKTTYSVGNSGVVVGSSDQVSFSNVTVTDATVISSYVSGGIVGMVATMATMNGCKVQNAVLDGDFAGGLVGAIAAGAGHYQITNNVVTAKFKKAPKPREYRWGGLIGSFDYSEDYVRNLYVTSNTVSLDVEVVGSPVGVSFYFGGLIGNLRTNGLVQFSGNKVESTEIAYSDDFFSENGDTSKVAIGGEIGYMESVKDKFSQKVEFTDEIVDVDIAADSRHDQYLGGIVGRALWFPNGGIYFSKSKVTGIIDSKNAETRRVVMGGLVAHAEERENNMGTSFGLKLQSSKDDLTLAMTAATKNTIKAGGLFGYALIRVDMVDPSNDGNVSSLQTAVTSFNNKNLIDAKSSIIDSLQVGGLVGEVDARNGICVIKESGVQGDIHATAPAFNGDAAEGGLAGKILARRAFIGKNTSEGNIAVNLGTTGYIVGSLSTKVTDLEPDLTSDPPQYYGLVVYDNYHYGKSDVDVANALGELNVKNSYISNWKTAGKTRGYSIVYNYRNAIDDGTKVLAAEGNLHRTGNGKIVTLDFNQVYDGIIPESEMKSRLFTYSLIATSREFESENWENLANSLPHVSDVRTVFRVKINLNRIYSQLTEADLALLKDYLYDDYSVDPSEHTVIAYTEQNGKVGRNFQKSIQALSADFGIFDGAILTDLESAVFTDNTELHAEENEDYKVVYQVGEYTYDDLEETLLYPIFLWPKVETVKRFGSTAVVPPVYAVSGATMREYYPQFVVVCKAEVCGQRFGTPLGGEIISFAEVFGKIYKNSDVPADHAKILYLVYSTTTKQPPLMTLADGDKLVGISVNGYGYKDGALEMHSTKPVSGTDYPETPIASKFNVGVDAGYELVRWSVDFWAYKYYTVATLEKCYDETASLAVCATAKTFNSSEFMNSGKILDALHENASDEHAILKWNMELDADQMLDMDSAISAIVRSGEEYFYHLHVNPVVEAVPYTITFDANAGDYPVFVSKYTDTLVVYSLESEESAALPMLYSTEACLEKWLAPNGAMPSPVLEKLSSAFLQNIAPKNNTFNLQANWVALGEPDICAKISTKPIYLKYTKGGAERGRVYLWQNLVNPDDDTLKFRHDFKADVMDVPELKKQQEQYWFHVGSEPETGYALASVEVVKKVKSGPISTTDVTTLNVAWGENEFFVDWNVEETTLNATFVAAFNVPLVLNKDDVFYDLDFTQGHPLTVLDIPEQIKMPSWIYTTNSCVVGWAYSADAVSYDFSVSAVPPSDELYEKLSGTKKLYAIWADAETCVNDLGYVSVKVEAENGNVELIEGADESRVHQFGEDGLMILPPDAYTAGIKVRAHPESGFRLNRIEMEENGKKETIENGSLIGYGQYGFVLRAYFDGSSDIEGPVLEQSGNAVRFSFKQDNFVKGDSAHVHILFDNGTDAGTVDKIIYCPASDCDIEWEKLPLDGGKYRFKAWMFDGVDSTSFERKIDVDKEIAVGRKGEWHMLALSDVVMDDVAWDGDEKFYWWNESSSYGTYWQYQELKGKNAPEQGRGYWYNSLEGRPLKLDGEAFVDVLDWNLEYEINGWNLVANPYGWYLDLEVDTNYVPFDEEAYRESMRASGLEADEDFIEQEKKWSKPSMEFWRWNGEKSQYEQARILKPYEAVWVKLNHGASTKTLEAKPFYLGTVEEDGSLKRYEAYKSLNRRLAKASGESGWTLQLVLSDSKGKMDSWNVLGAGKAAWDSEEPPAGMGDRVNLSILNGGKRLAKSVRAETEVPAYEWNVELSATSARRGFLEVAGADALLEKGLRVFVTLDGNTREIHTGEKLPVELAPTVKTALIRVAPAAKSLAGRELRGLYAVQAGGALQITFDASGMGGARARVGVYDMKGTAVAGTAFQAVDGSNTLSLTLPRRGLYMVRVAVAGQVAVRRVLFR